MTAHDLSYPKNLVVKLNILEESVASLTASPRILEHSWLKNGRKTLKRNKKQTTSRDLLSLLALFFPAVGFGLFLLAEALLSGDTLGAATFSNLPWQVYLITFVGSIATIGGVCDWVFHRLFVTSSPKESKSHLLALGSGGVPLFFLMGTASLIPEPKILLIPIIVVTLYTTTLICYDEFVFHWRRCCRLETLFHRLLVFGNGIAWLAWMHWVYS